MLFSKLQSVALSLWAPRKHIKRINTTNKLPNPARRNLPEVRKDSPIKETNATKIIATNATICPQENFSFLFIIIIRNISLWIFSNHYHTHSSTYIQCANILIFLIKCFELSYFFGKNMLQSTNYNQKVKTIITAFCHRQHCYFGDDAMKTTDWISGWICCIFWQPTRYIEEMLWL